MFEQLLPLIVVAVFVFVKWLIENAVRPQGGDEPDGTPEIPRRTQTRPEPRQPRDLAGSGESDEEKMRRFMEALGLPPESAPPPARKKPEPQAPRHPAMQPRPAAMSPERRGMNPVPPIVHQPVPPISHPARRTIAKPIERVPKVEMPKVDQPASVPVSENAPAMEITSIPRQISIQPEQLLEREKRKPARRKPGETGAEQPSAAGVLREQTGDRAALRRAILLKEILGPPKGLQSATSSNSFSPL